MSVSYTELDGSPIVDVKQDILHVTRRLKCAWGDRNTFVIELLGGQDVEYTAAICYHTVVRPFPGKNTGTGSICAYEYAEVEAQFSTAAIAVVGEMFEPGAEFTTLDCTKFKWENASGDALVPEEAPGKLNVFLEYSQIWKNLIAVPSAALSIIGTVNSTLINPYLHINPILVNLDFQAETLLYHPPVVGRSWDRVNSRFAYDLTYRFTYRPNWDGGTARGWNWVWRASKGEYQQIYSTDTSAVINLYQTASFGSLFV